MDILKFLTAGSVDDGKSTLIGRMLYDTESILQDQLEAIQNSSRKNDDGSIDLAILTDGLKAEREQGITIDVAYKYFQTQNVSKELRLMLLINISRPRNVSSSLLIPQVIFNTPEIWLLVLLTQI